MCGEKIEVNMGLIFLVLEEPTSASMYADFRLHGAYDDKELARKCLKDVVESHNRCAIACEKYLVVGQDVFERSQDVYENGIMDVQEIVWKLYIYEKEINECFEPQYSQYKPWV
jgi:hypothetical protein